MKAELVPMEENSVDNGVAAGPGGRKWKGTCNIPRDQCTVDGLGVGIKVANRS